MFPPRGRFHLELPTCFTSFLERGKKVLRPKKLCFPVSRVYRFRECRFSMIPRLRAAEEFMRTPEASPQRASFWNKHLLEGSPKGKVECPNNDLSKPQCQWLSTAQLGLWVAAAPASSDLLSCSRKTTTWASSVNGPGLSCHQRFVTVLQNLQKPLNIWLALCCLRVKGFSFFFKLKQFVMA